jgi:ribosomal protein S12 methylthiotransferase accessory factor
MADGKRIQVSFPGGKRADAQVDGFTVHSDQPREEGGGGVAPDPFTLFLSSLALCGGVYAQGFCEARELSTEGLGLELEAVRSADGKRVERVVYRLRLPQDFPEKYRKAIARSVGQCTVKRHLTDPPEFDIVVED